MTSLNIHKLLPRRALTSRGSAREISQEISDALSSGEVELELDFQDILGFSPSFFDERSEEHTSELQSRRNLVCRLLLEKKKKKTHHHLI